MKCSVKNCGRAGNHHMKTPSGTTAVLCETHARDLFKKLHPSSQTKEEEQELAPVIDIKTRKRIGSWNGFHVAKMVDPEGPRYPTLYSTLSRKWSLLKEIGNKDRIEDLKYNIEEINRLDQELEAAKKAGDPDAIHEAREDLHNEIHFNLGTMDTMPRDRDFCDLCKEDEEKNTKEGFRVI